MVVSFSQGVSIDFIRYEQEFLLKSRLILELIPYEAAHTLGHLLLAKQLARCSFI